jgi:hypothetical protein
MTNRFRLALAAAAVLVIAVVGIAVLPKVGPGRADASPSAHPSVTAIVSPVPLPTGMLPAGTYVITPSAHPAWTACPHPAAPGCSDPPAADAIRFTLTVPEGWVGVDGTAIWPAELEAAPPGGASVGFSRGSWLHSDPCRQDLKLPDVNVGPTVDDFANALADNRFLEVTTPVDVTLAGYRGKYLDLQVPADLSRCPTSYHPWEPGIYAQGPGQRWHLWILDVRGVRVVVMGTDYAATSAQHRAELEAIVDSITIEP